MHDKLEDLENDLRVIFRHFGDAGSDCLGLEGIEQLLAAQGEKPALLAGTPEDVLLRLEGGASDTLTFMGLYRFVWNQVYKEFNADEAENWLGHLRAHIREKEGATVMPRASQVLSPKAQRVPATALHPATHAAEPGGDEEAPLPTCAEQPVASDHAASFDALTAFLTGGGHVDQIKADFASLTRLAGLDTSEGYTYEELRDAVLPTLGSRYTLKRIFETLDKRINEEGKGRQHRLYRTKPLAGVRALIGGAGPVGLRCAIELRMMGAHVTVLEKRSSFTRLNILHLWEWVHGDLMSLGAKIMYPKFGSAAAFLHIGTRQLQNLLFKVALMIGVEVHFDTEFVDVLRPSKSGEGFWQVQAKEGQDGKEVLFPCDLLLGAAGACDAVCVKCGMESSHVAMSGALGMVFNLEHKNSKTERNLKEFSWARQFNGELFCELAAMGRDLENVVYYQGETHYFVMTPKQASLVQFGVLENVGPSPTNRGQSDVLATATVNAAKMREYARGVAEFFGVPTDCRLVGEPQIFDFSSRRCSADAMQVLQDEGRKNLLLCSVGDSLLEPFWPEGLGVTRGFLGVLDTCWALRDLKTARLDKIASERRTTFETLKSLNNKSRGELLQEGAAMKNYSVDPSTRYRHSRN